MKRGIVVATHPEDHSVDIVMSDGRRLAGVQVMSKNASARSGTIDMPAVPEKDGDKWDITKENGQDQVALVDFVGEVPVVVGYLFPQISQMTFEDPELRIDRHQSDVITTIDGKGNIQIVHPGGTYIRVGEDPDKQDFSGANFDESLAVDRNTETKAWVRVELAGGDVVLTMDPSGEVTLKSSKKVVVDTPTVEMTGDLNVAGQVTAVGDVIGQNVSLAWHLHPVVGAVTLIPIPLS